MFEEINDYHMKVKDWDSFTYLSYQLEFEIVHRKREILDVTRKDLI